MYWFIVCQIIASFIYVAYLVYRYALPHVHLAVKITVYLTWLLSFGIVVLIPFDIYYSMKDDQGMIIVWKIIYWSIFSLTWLLLPIAQEYQSAGQFTVLQKLKRAIINNLIIYGVFVLIGAAFLGYLLFIGHFDLQALIPVAMAASNAFGMFLVVIFLSYGAVAIPKNLWRQKDNEIKLKKNQFSASVLTRKKQNILQELQLKYKQALWYKRTQGQSAQINHIISLVPEKFRQKWGRSVPDLGKVDIVKIHKDIKQYTLELGRLESRWEQLLFSTFRIQDILKDTNSSTHRIQSTLFVNFKYQFLNYFVWLWYCRIKRIISPFFAVFFGMFACAIILAELSSFLQLSQYINPLSQLVKIQSFIALDCGLLIALTYIAFCVYYALFKLKFSNYYGLYWNQQTDSASLIFFALNCSRVSTPLCYNFLQLLGNKTTSFSAVMGTTNMVPVFGSTFNVVFPVLLIILIIFNALDMYTRLSKILVNFNMKNIQQGKRLLRKARIDLETKVLNSNGKNLSDFRSYKSEFGTGTQQSINKENSSSDSVQIKPVYFNQYANMADVIKILSM